MTSPHIIGLVGPAGSGKSTLAALLAERAGYERTSFAGPIKHMLRALLEYQSVFPETIERMLYGDLKEIPNSYLSGATPRHAMQTLGTEWRDLISRDLWLNIWEAQADSRCVVDDLRFQHEAKQVRAHAGLIVTVRRPGRHPITGHISETEWEDIVPDVYITNVDGNPDDMWTQLVAALARRNQHLPAAGAK
jgi:hypothetical protein